MGNGLIDTSLIYGSERGEKGVMMNGWSWLDLYLGLCWEFTHKGEMINVLFWGGGRERERKWGGDMRKGSEGKKVQYGE